MPDSTRPVAGRRDDTNVGSERALSAAQRSGRREGALVVDARALHASGIGRYLRELLAAWMREPPFERLVLLGDADALSAFATRGTDAPLVEVVSHGGGFYTPAAQRSWLRARRSDAVRTARVAFFPHWDAPVVAMPPRSVVTVHDLIHFRVPDAFPATKRWVARPVLHRVVRRAARVVCVSHATASDLVDEMRSATPQVDVIPNGVSDAFTRRVAEGPLVEQPYLLCVGNQKPHKNLSAAVRVLARLRDAGHTRLRLVAVGRRFGDEGSVRAAARALGQDDAVIELGEVSDVDLARLYAHCAALLFPSRYEGFGLPVVEAMAMGAPVVACDTPAVAEAVGGVYEVFGTNDVEGMARAVEAALGDPAHRAALAERGRARAAEFSWIRTARRTAAVLQAVAAGAVRAETRRLPAPDAS